MKCTPLLRNTLLMTAMALLATVSLAQTRLSGRVTDAATQRELAGVNLAVRGKVIGTLTDTKGVFNLVTGTPAPFTLVVSSVGYETQSFVITGSRNDLIINMIEQINVGQEVVVSASRMEEELLKSPASVEKLDIRALQVAPTPSVYDALGNLKGIDLATQGLLFKSVNMRGFSDTGNPRTVQLIDGMDNSAPGLNFPIDNIVGIPDLDLASVEVLQGAASALYGPNAVQGLILMSSKSPFDYQGLSANVKAGLLNASNRDEQTTPYFDASLRYAKAVNNRVAFKMNLSMIQAKDWQATNYENLNLGGNADPVRGPGTRPNYDGTNTYGDEFAANLQTVAQGLIDAKLLPSAALALVPNVNVSRTGFLERDLVDYGARSYKANAAVHYRLTDQIELIGQYNYGIGTTTTTGPGRYSFRDFVIGQGKIELRGDNFTLRAYATQEQSGKTYSAGLTAVALGEAIKASPIWFGEYVGAYVQARQGGQADDAAQVAARQFADRNRPAPGSAAFNTLLDTYRSRSIGQGGGGFLDKSSLIHLDGTYNFKNQIKFMELLVGANYRRYTLNSEGTFFADNVDGRTGSIGIGEFGGFAQVAKSLFGDHLKITASGRYDKNQNFDGQFTPRVSAVATFGEHNLRVSYQTGFRIPTNQNQYADLNTPQARLIGGLPEFDRRYNLATAYTLQTVQAAGGSIPARAADPAFQQQALAALTQLVTPQVQAGVTAAVTAGVQAAVAAGQIPNTPAAIQAAITAGVTAALPGAVQQAVTANAPAFIGGAAASAAAASMTPYQARKLQPERVLSYELGYRGVLAKQLFVDVNAYWSTYKNFIGSVVLVQPTKPVSPQLTEVRTGVFGDATTRNVYSRPANSAKDITTSGWGLGLTYRLNRGYALMGNISNNTLNNFEKSDEVQFDFFNTPKYRYNLMFSKRPAGSSKIGFSLNVKHQDEFIWQGFAVPSDPTQPFYTNTIVPAINNVDAQVSYKVRSLKSLVRLGATNLFGKPYIQAHASSSVGSTFYVSLLFDELLN
jgi:iron complex outermembrane recepter protein